MAGEEQQTRVLYKAIADFSQLTRKAATAKKAIRELRQEEAKLNAESASGSTAAAVARARDTKAAAQHSNVVKDIGRHTRDATKATREHTTEVDRSEVVTRRSLRTTEEHSRQLGVMDRVLSGLSKRFADQRGYLDRSSTSHRRHRREVDHTGRAMATVTKQAEGFHRSLDKLGRWRPRLIPPFIALIPIIASLLALINPLVAGLGAIGAAAFGLAANLSSVAGAALSAIPALAALLSMAAALKIAFGGIGNVFKTFTAMKEAGASGGGGGSSREELTQAEELERAWEKYRRAIEDVRYAQEDLDEERKNYIKRLADLRKAVDRAAMSEARAAANSQLARENYANILADPGSTKGMKMSGAVDIDEAKANLEDVQQQNRENAEELRRMEAEGIEGDRQMIMAKRRLTDAIWAERDAYLALRNVQNGSNRASGGGASAADKFRQALDKLSPSARAVVLTILAMKDAWDAVKKTVQESFFSEIVNDVERLRLLFPSLTEMLSDTAGAAGRVARAFIQMITSPEWLEDFRRLGKQNIPIIENMGAAFLSILNVLRDLTFAAGPFTILMTEGLKEGAANFAALVDSARETGRLAAWLDKVNSRMSQWWRIIKNIGMTLFNYGAAAEGFGQWITDAFERMTDRWRSASEAAREAGSPFQKFLEDIKPLLTEVSGMFGDFFRWFAEVSADEENIAVFRDIVRVIREQLGPALGDLLDTLSKSGLGVNVVEALASILDALDTFLENGGQEGMKAFWDAVGGLFDVLNGLIDITPEPILRLIATTFGTLAALRFFGLNHMLGLLLKVGKSAGVANFFKGLPALFSGGGGRHVLGQGGRHLATRGAATAVAGGAAATGGAAAAGGAAAEGTFITRLLGRARTGAKGSLLTALSAMVVGTISDEFIKDGQGGARDQAGHAISGTATGTAIGGTIGSIIPGIGTLIGAIIGGAIGNVGGNIVGIANSDRTEEEKKEAYGRMAAGSMFGLGGMAIGALPEETINEFFKKIGDWWDDKVVGPFNEAATSVSNWWNESVVTPFNEAATNVSNWWNDNVVRPFSAFVAMMGRAWDQLVVQPFTVVSQVIGEWWYNEVVSRWVAASEAVSTWWNQNVVIPFNTAATNVSNWWNDNVVTRWNQVAGFIGEWWNTSVVSRWNAVANSISTWWTNSVVSRWNAVADGISNWWTTSVVTRWNAVADTISKWWSEYVVAPFQGIVAGVAAFVDKVRNFNLADALTNFFNRQFQEPSKNPKGFNTGGLVGGTGTGDTVPAMLTPGEVVIRKPRVDQIGAGNLLRLNAGSASLGSVLKSSRGFASPSFFESGGMVPQGTSVGASLSRDMGNNVFNQAPLMRDVTIINPTPEPASDSLPRTLRSLSYLGRRGS